MSTTPRGDNRYRLSLSTAAVREFGRAFLDDLQRWADSLPWGDHGGAGGVVPIGGVIPYYGTTAPTSGSWLLCDGSAFSSSTYPALAKHLGGTTLPDLRGRVWVGLDDLGGSDAGRLSVANTLGGSGGTQTHTLALSEIPAHDHSKATQYGTHTTHPPAFADSSAWPTVDSGAGAADLRTGTAGSGGAHNNMQPYILGGWIIRAR